MLAAACNRQASDARLDRAESLMEQHPDSALAILSPLSSTSWDNPALRARHALLLSMALDKTYDDRKDFTVLQPAIDYYLSHGTPDERLRTLYYQARIYQNADSLDQAMRGFIEGLNFRNEISDSLTLARMLVGQGQLYSQFCANNDYIRNNIEAADIYGNLNKAALQIKCLCKALDGYIVNEDSIQAEKCLQQIKNLIDINGNELTQTFPFVLNYLNHFGSCDEISEQLELMMRYELPENCLIDLAAAYNKLGEGGLALEYLQMVDTNSVDDISRYFLYKADIMDSIRNYAEAYGALRNYLSVYQTEQVEIDDQGLPFSENKHNLIFSHIKTVHKKNIIIILSLCICFILIIATIALYYRNRLIHEKKIRVELEKERVEEEKRRIEEEKKRIQEEKKRIEVEKQQKIDQLSREFESLQEICNEYSAKEISPEVNDAIKGRIEILNSLLSNQILSNITKQAAYEKWCAGVLKDKQNFLNTTRLAFKSSHPEFISHLEDHGLTDDEINHMCLFAIGLSAKDAGAYLGQKSHYHNTSDIRKKLGLKEGKQLLAPYIRSLLKNK